MQYSSCYCTKTVVFDWGEARHKSLLDSPAGLRGPHALALRGAKHTACTMTRQWLNFCAVLSMTALVTPNYIITHTRKRSILPLQSLCFLGWVASAAILVNIQEVSL